MPSVEQFKHGFFDRAAVTNAVDKATRRVLSKCGAFVRKRAKSSIRKRKKISAPGSPPSSHVGTLKKLIYFAYDQTAKTVIVGPALFQKTRMLGGKTVPQSLEEGGTSEHEEFQVTGGRWVGRGSPLLKDKKDRPGARDAAGKFLKRGTIVAADLTGRPKRVVKRALVSRPFMKPALDAEMPKFAPLFKDSVSK